MKQHLLNSLNQCYLIYIKNGRIKKTQKTFFVLKVFYTFANL